MNDNIFLAGARPAALDSYLQYNKESRGNLGDSLPVLVYRMLEYSLKEELRSRYGKEEQIDIFRHAGRMAGEYFARNFLNLDQPMDSFVSELQNKMQEFRIGVLRIEESRRPAAGLFSPFPRTRTAPVFPFSARPSATTMRASLPVFYLYIPGSRIPRSRWTAGQPVTVSAASARKSANKRGSLSKQRRSYSMQKS